MRIYPALLTTSIALILGSLTALALWAPKLTNKDFHGHIFLCLTAIAIGAIILQISRRFASRLAHQEEQPARAADASIKPSMTAR